MKKILTIFFAFFAMILVSACGEKDSDIKPVIKAGTQMGLSSQGGSIPFNYSIVNPVEGAVLSAESDQEWLAVEEITADKVMLNLQTNYTGEERYAVLTLKYPGAEDLITNVSQEVGGPARTLTFELEVVSTSSRGVVINCTPSDLEATYVAMATSKADLDQWNSLEALAESDYQYFMDWADAFGAESPEQAMAMFLRKGKMENYDIQLDKPMADYYFYAYGMNPDGSVTSPQLYKVAFSTTEPEAQECTFDFEVRPGISYTQVNVRPSSIYVSYLWDVIPASEYAALGDDPRETIIKGLKEAIDANHEEGGELRFGELISYHNKTYSFNDLKEGEDYVVYAFGCDVAGVATTPIMTKTFTEKRLQKVDCSFSMAFSNVRAASFAATITPSDPSLKWFAYTLPYEVYEDFDSIDAMTEEVLNSLSVLDVYLTDPECLYLHSGSKMLSSYEMLAGELDEETRQVVAAFVVDENGCRVSEITQAFVNTGSYGSKSDLVINMDVVQNGDDVRVNFTPSTVEPYFYDIQEKAFYESFDSDEAFANNIVSNYYVTGLLPYKLACRAAYMETASLTPGVEYIAVAFGYDGGFMSTSMFKKEFVVSSTGAQAHAAKSVSHNGTLACPGKSLRSLVSNTR